MNIKEAIHGILSKSLTTEQAFAGVKAEDKIELAAAIGYIRERLSKTSAVEPLVKYNERGQWSMNKMEPLSKPPVSEAQRKAMWAAAKGKSSLGIPAKVGKDFADSDEGGKLPLKKAIKPGPTLNYGKMNPEHNPMSNPEAAKQAKAARYAEAEAKAPVLDYSSGRMSTPKSYAGVAAQAHAVRTQFDAQRNESAIDAIARRNGTKKAEGVNEDTKTINPERMTAKNEMMGYGGGSMMSGAAKGDMAGDSGASATELEQSEKEPHKDDPHHEAKEKEKAKKIKAEAEGLLDMHKKESDGLRTVKVSKDNEMKIKAVRAQPAC